MWIRAGEVVTSNFCLFSYDIQTVNTGKSIISAIYEHFSHQCLGGRDCPIAICAYLITRASIKRMLSPVIPCHGLIHQLTARVQRCKNYGTLATSYVIYCLLKESRDRVLMLITGRRISGEVKKVRWLSSSQFRDKQMFYIRTPLPAYAPVHRFSCIKTHYLFIGHTTK